MKKLIFSVMLALSAFFAGAATRLTLDNGINIVFEGCADGSVRFEALGKKPSAPVKEFELSRETAAEDFVQAEDGSYRWNGYTVIPAADGYTLLFNGEELYASSFNEEPSLLREIRNWKTATEFYGFGEASRNVSLRNQSFAIWNVSKYGDHAYLFIPFYVTNTNTCVYYNAGSNDRIYFQDGKDFQVYRSAYHRIECFVRQDLSLEESVAKFYRESGASCLLPKWAFGFIQSKYGYKTQEEVTELVEGFKMRDIPLSAVVLDLYWFNRMGDISFTNAGFPEPKKMNDYMEQNGVKLVTITEPFFTTECVNYKELLSGKMLCKDNKGKIRLWRDWWCLGDKEGALFNPLAKKAPSFMAEKYSAMLEDGIDGFWTDLGEPENAPDDIKVGKYALIDFHNYYNYYWTKALYDGMKSVHPDKRLFIMSRSGYTGIAKFNVSVWSGDVAVSWPSLENQIAYGLNAGLSGLAYWGSDVGGFTPEKTNPELFVRWYQFGAFTPVFRAHGTDSREPWIFTDRETEIVSKYIRARTALLPYVYSTARQTMSGIPMMRPMFYESSSVPQEYMESQYMFGDFILVAPVYRQLAAEKEKTVYLPCGNWYEFSSMKKIKAEGGTAVTVPLTLDDIPVYIKEGAVIPAEKDGALYVLLVPADGVKNSFVLYDDDGESEQYKDGAYSEIELSLDGFNVTAKRSGNADFLGDDLILAVPASVKTGSGWTLRGNFKTKKVSVSEMENGFSL